MFGDRSGTFIRGKKELLLLLKTLTALVPHEPVFALKVREFVTWSERKSCLSVGTCLPPSTSASQVPGTGQ